MKYIILDKESRRLDGIITESDIAELRASIEKEKRDKEMAEGIYAIMQKFPLKSIMKIGNKKYNVIRRIKQSHYQENQIDEVIEFWEPGKEGEIIARGAVQYNPISETSYIAEWETRKPGSGEGFAIFAEILRNTDKLNYKSNLIVNPFSKEYPFSQEQSSSSDFPISRLVAFYQSFGFYPLSGKMMWRDKLKKD